MHTCPHCGQPVSVLLVVPAEGHEEDPSGTPAATLAETPRPRARAREGTVAPAPYHPVLTDYAEVLGLLPADCPQIRQLKVKLAGLILGRPPKPGDEDAVIEGLDHLAELAISAAVLQPADALDLCQYIVEQAWDLSSPDARYTAFYHACLANHVTPPER